MANLIKIENYYPDAASLGRLYDYIMSHAAEAGSYGCEVNYAIQQMLAVKHVFGKTQYRQLRHYVFSVKAWELDIIHGYDGLLNIGWLVGTALKEYQILYGLHINTSFPHIHILINTTSYVTGGQLRNDNGMLFRIKYAVEKTYPKLNVDLRWSDPHSPVNRLDEAVEDDFLRID
ncbi:MAG: relaxase/mobilization nuclease domain-containing protein [Oscillospiraceae bacterium]